MKMITVSLIALALVLWSGSVLGDTQWNPWTGEFEQVNSPNARLEYDPWNATWGFVDPAPVPAYTVKIDPLPSYTDPVADIVKSAAPNNDSGTK